MGEEKVKPVVAAVDCVEPLREVPIPLDLLGEDFGI